MAKAPKKAATKSAFDTFSADDLFRGGTYRGNPMSPEQIETIRNNAQAFRSSLLWTMLKSEIQFNALKTLAQKGETELDIRMARAYGNIVQQMDEVLEQWAKGRQGA